MHRAAGGGRLTGLGAAAYRLLAGTGVATRLRRRRPAATILCYHNVVPDPLEGRVGDRSLHLGAGRLAEHLDWIAHAFTPVPLLELLARLADGRSVDGLAAVTFDDAYAGALRNAGPLLAARGIPATFFVVTSAANHPAPFWWDRLGDEGRLDDRTRLECRDDLQGDPARIATAYPPLASGGTEGPDLLAADWTALREAARIGFGVESHSRTHRNLTRLPPDELRLELEGSRHDLREALGRPPRLVSYPYGCLNGAVRQAAADAGYEGGIALSYGRVAAGDEPFSLIRVNVPAGLPVATLECWASGIRWKPPS